MPEMDPRTLRRLHPRTNRAPPKSTGLGCYQGWLRDASPWALPCGQILFGFVHLPRPRRIRGARG
jgi:hypothetical protein